MINDLLNPTCLAGLDPGIDGERTGRVEISAVWNAHVGGGSVEAKGLADFARPEGRTPVERAIMAALYVRRVAIPWPPTDHAGRWRRAAGCHIDTPNHAP